MERKSTIASVQATLIRSNLWISKTGWISGGLMMALPRDPFFLVTHDGGSHLGRDRPCFRRRPQSASSPNTGLKTSRAGSSSSTTHAARRNGNRYELHESMTGGRYLDAQAIEPPN